MSFVFLLVVLMCWEHVAFDSFSKVFVELNLVYEQLTYVLVSNIPHTLSSTFPTGVGIISSGVRNESDPALALLTDYIDGEGVSTGVRTASAIGLGE